MKADLSNQDPDDSHLDENDPVWRLLGKAPLQEPDGWFTARTLARCRNEELVAEPTTFSLSRMWRWAIGGGIALCLAGSLVFTQVHNETSDQQKDVQEAFQIVASVDADPDSSTPSSSWQDSSP